MQEKQLNQLADEAARPAGLIDAVEKAERICEDCKLLTPSTCLSGCKNWRIKNEFRKLNERAQESGFVTRLLNTLKNERRLEILEMVSAERHSIIQIKSGLCDKGFNHGLNTINQEYVQPLLEVGLVNRYQDSYCATLFGQKLSYLTRGFHDVAEVLSPHSECYEEVALTALTRNPLTREGLQEIIPEKNLSRVISRLQKSGLVESNIDKDYVFFFRTRRDPSLSELSSTEKKLYEVIPETGISARRLAGEAGICVRRAYKYVRKLKGKKLVFVRRKPPTYTVTAKGEKTGKILEGIRRLVSEATLASLYHNEQVRSNK
jgi:predicted transcriptional regulator